MPASDRAAATQAKLIAAGERLFAERGITSVSLREINTAAGQRNTSALHYHFGSREGLLRAILAPHLATLRTRRAAMIADRGQLDLRGAAEVLVVTHVAFLDGDASERAFVLIARQLATDPEVSTEAVVELLDEASIHDALDAFRAELSYLPPKVVETRIGIALMLLIHSVADRARAGTASGRGPDTDVEEFAAVLLDMFVGALTAPAVL